MRRWETWHWKKATKGSLKPSNHGFDPIRPRNVMANCLTEFSKVWAYNPKCEIGIKKSTRRPFERGFDSYPSIHPKGAIR